jgi:hypothetical protein
MNCRKEEEDIDNSIIRNINVIIDGQRRIPYSINELRLLMPENFSTTR